MAKDVYHEIVKDALEKDGWTITHDPYIIFYGKEKSRLNIDLGAEKIFGAEKGGIKIAVEIKSFLSPSIISDFHSALGQVLLYQIGLIKYEPERLLYLSIPLEIYNEIKELELIQDAIKNYRINLLIFDDRGYLQWIN
jgi:hypothetical protein